MQAGLHLGMSSQIALRQALAVIAQNIANAGTTGYRAENLRFDEVVARSRASSTSFPVQGEAFLSKGSGAIIKNWWRV